jgi:transcriptional regulator with XRE-family HTH domain
MPCGNGTLITSVQDIGALMRRVRKESGLTQRDAAALCNVSLPFLNSLEQGKESAHLGKALAVCLRFGIEVCLTAPNNQP